MARDVVLRSESAVHRAASFGDLYAIRWSGAPDAETLRNIRKDLDPQRRASSGLVYVGITGEDVAMPNVADQRRLAEFSRDMLSWVRALHLVLEGQSVRGSMMRSLFRGMVLAAKLGRDVAGLKIAEHTSKLLVHETVEGFAASACESLGLAAIEVQDALTRALPVRRAAPA